MLPEVIEILYVVKRERAASDTGAPTAAPVVLVQVIVTVWTKASRGAQGAALRHAVPEAMAIPAAVSATSEPSVIRHDVRYKEQQGFRTPTASSVRRESLRGTIHEHNLAISLDDGSLRVDLAWTWGAPMRHPVRGIMTLAPDKWGQVHFNYRISGGYDAHWVYAQSVANIGLFVQPNPSIFLATQPTKRYANMADLW